ncbi:MAG: hypothetical protein ACKVJK_19205 [Methylophagaceae bacterium]|jgi:hypothetical protein|tara:strand:+ start:806 stop:1507 length:702 start_codon:yes stop_codon:yes gene_type:complete
MKKYIPGETKAQRKVRKNLNKNPNTTKQTTVETVKTVTNQHNIAFVIGNGTSRNPISLESLRPLGEIYGCNAVYRDFMPDHLVAVDTKMVLEINKAGIQHRVPTWTNPNRAYNEMTGFNFFQPSKGWSSGPTALWLASDTTKYDTIYILGFDYEGTGTLVNNIYAGTQNYKAPTEKATYYGNWLKQTIITCQNNPEKRYIRVVGDSFITPPELLKLENIENMYVKDFKNSFNI